MWFRDDDVLIDKSLHSVLTIYQPLFDPRDFNDIKLTLDRDEPNLLHHVHPNVPTFMYKDLDSMHAQEMGSDPKNPELYSFTAKKHQKSAIDIDEGGDGQKFQVTDYRLPFLLIKDHFSNIDNTGKEIEKHYRKIEINVTDRIKHKCAYAFWKILIDGETYHLKKKVSERNPFDEAESRMSKTFSSMNLDE